MIDVISSLDAEFQLLEIGVKLAGELQLQVSYAFTDSFELWKVFIRGVVNPIGGLNISIVTSDRNTFKRL